MKDGLTLLFKGFAGIVILFGALVVLISLFAMNSIGELASPGILIPFAIIGWVVLHRRKSADGDGDDFQIDAASTARPVHIGDKLQGVGATIEIRTAGLAIRRQGTTSFFVHGLKGEKLLPFKSITAVQLREPGRSTSGYIQFSLVGAVESSRGLWDAATDENTVLFTREQLPEFLGLRDLVEEVLGAEAHQTVAPQPSRAQELATLASLRDAGHLSSEEFATEKMRILAR